MTVDHKLAYKILEIKCLGATIDKSHIVDAE